MILWGWFLLPLSSFFVAEIIMALLYAYLYFVLKVKKIILFDISKHF